MRSESLEARGDRPSKCAGLLSYRRLGSGGVAEGRSRGGAGEQRHGD